MRWIISKRDDLTWFLGSSLVSYAVLGFMAMGAAVVPFQFLWLFFLDGPHVFATVSRTYCDAEARKKLGWFLWIVVPFVLVGPALVGLGLADSFFLFAVCWQQVHVTKQHFGFAMLYRAKYKERSKIDILLDRWFLVASLFLPLGIFVLKTRSVLELLQVLPAAMVAYAALGVVWIGRHLYLWRRGAPVNWPKLALFAAVIPLQWLALLHASNYGPSGIIRAAIVLGTFHSFQYHRLLWFHNRNRYGAPEARERHGLAALLASNVGIYFVLAAGLNAFFAFVPVMVLPAQIAQAAAWGLSFTHYTLDAKIWHVREDRELAAALRLA